ncbi:MAG TPA: 6,7-dimethyl-8-ribityllumazine synthase [Planctomycetia bacterium]|nr:6,7-dimethyl-8-ribityllumazine synthase [Planctomycetia bacterium]
MNEITGSYAAPQGKFALVASRFNEVVVDRLVSGAIDALVRHGVKPEAVEVFRVPGALEIPLVASRAAKSGKYVAVVCLGAVIRGATAHFDIVAHGSAQGIARVALESEIPVLNAILTTDTVEQALDRAGAKAGNKGFEAGMAALEMVDLLRRMEAGNAR